MTAPKPHPKEATCHRCRDIHQRRVQAALDYRLANLCPWCFDFVFEVQRCEARREAANAYR